MPGGDNTSSLFQGAVPQGSPEPEWAEFPKRWVGMELLPRDTFAPSFARDFKCGFQARGDSDDLGSSNVRWNSNAYAHLK